MVTLNVTRNLLLSGTAPKCRRSTDDYVGVASEAVAILFMCARHRNERSALGTLGKGLFSGLVVSQRGNPLAGGRQIHAGDIIKVA